MNTEQDLIATRRSKLKRLRKGGNAFPNTFRPDRTANELRKTYKEKSKEDLEKESFHVSVAGRILLRRMMGKASFITIQDRTDQIQCYLRESDIGQDNYRNFQQLSDIGDFVGITGILMRTNTGELTVHAETFDLLVKSLRPLPEKFHGVVNQEFRYRNRHVDLIMNENSRRTFAVRSQVTQVVREFFNKRGFLEVETPMLHPIPGGASAEPFVTYHNAIKRDLYLRVAPELYLKRLVVGGFERVYEINRNFRNEGLSPRHNPEFTMLEFYQSYADYEDLIGLTSNLIREIVQTVCGDLKIEFQGHSLDFSTEFRKIAMANAVAEILRVEPLDISDESRLHRLASDTGVSVERDATPGEVLVALFDQLVEHTLMAPTFVTGFPASVSPLARRSDKDQNYADRFELIVAGREIANGFSELNDPELQAAVFRDQLTKREGGNTEAMYYDEDYVTALEYGMPPTAGEGIGIDRLVMLLTDSPSIRDVLLFPQMKDVQS